MNDLLSTVPSSAHPELAALDAARGLSALLRAIDRDARREARTLPYADECRAAERRFGAAMTVFSDTEARVTGEELVALRQLVREELNPWFLRSRYWSRSYLKPHGYAGDFRMLEWVYDLEHAGGPDHIEYLDERLALGDEMLALARLTGSPEVEGLAQFRRISSLLEAGRVQDARAAHRALAAIATAQREPLLQHTAACFDVVWASIEGRGAEALALAAEALRIGRLLQPAAEVEYTAQQLALLHQAGRLSEGVAALEAAAAANAELSIYRVALCLARLEAGENEAGVDDFEQLAADDFAAIRRDQLWFAAHCLFAEACARIGDAARARALYGLLLPYRDRFVQVGMATWWGSAERFLALLAETMGDLAAAAAHSAAAAERNAAART
jgi:hypothetical protein